MPRSGGEVADGGGVQAGHDQRAVVLPGDGPAPLCDQLSQLGGPRGAEQYVPAGAGLDQLRRGHVGEQPAAADDDQVVGGLRHLAHQVAGDQDGAAVGGQLPEEPADPVDALRVQAVDRLVEHQHRRVAEQRGGDAEPLLHAERETADPAPGHRFEPGQPQHLGDALLGYAVGLRDRPQVRPAGPAGVQGGRVEQRADLAQRPDQPGVAAAADQGPAGGRRGESENDPHRGGLARAVRAEEAGHPPRADGEAQVVDRGDRAEALADPLHLDHAGR